MMPVKRRTSIALLAVACLSAVTAAIAGSRETAKTIGGFLYAGPEGLDLNGTPLVKSSAGHVAWDISSVYPPTGPARLVLVGFDTEDNFCRFAYRVIEFRERRSPVQSNDFGYCGYQIDYFKPVPPVYKGGEWRIPLEAIEGGRNKPKLKWYVYRDGEVSIGGKVVDFEKDSWKE